MLVLGQPQQLDALHLQEIVQSYQPYIANIRRYLHQHPELSWCETNTITFLKEEILHILKSCPYKTSLEEKTGGLVLDVDVDPSYTRILFRADIDALPIQEATELDFQSKYPGIMHACGHDCHAAMLLGTLKILSEHQLSLKHNLRFVWQRAEELVMDTLSGGAALVRDGVLKDICKAFALHLDARVEKGLFISKPGPILANASSINFTIKCSGGHVMYPEKGSNAIDILADIHHHLKGFALRFLGAEEKVVFIPSQSHAGNTHNIMPEEGSATYTLRSFLSPHKVQAFVKALEKRIASLVKIYPKAILSHFTHASGYPPLVNSPEEYLSTNELLQQAGFKTHTCNPLYAGDDFAFYVLKKPGVYWHLGAKQGDGFDHHTSRFNPDDSILWMGAAYWLLLATHSYS